MFADWVNSKLSALFFEFQINTLPKDTILYNIGDKAEYFYFILSGEVEVF